MSLKSETERQAKLPADRSLNVVRLSDVKARKVEWFWPGFMPLGMFTLIGGAPGLGKSSILLDAAARATTGAAFPGEVETREPRDVLILAIEDDTARTIRPRIEACGGDPSRVHVIQSVMVHDDDGDQRPSVMSLQRDLDLVHAAARRLNVGLMSIDPINAYFGAARDSHKDAEVRDVLMPWVDAFAGMPCALVASTHFNKSAGPVVNRFLGSIGFVGLSRSAWAVFADPRDPLRRVLLPAKVNIAPDSAGYGYTLGTPSQYTGKPFWDGDRIAMNADAWVAENEHKARDSIRLAAETWLETELAQGPKPAANIQDRAQARNFSIGTLRRAKADLGVQSTKEGAAWVWSLPE